jgi:hypothetical protein
VGSTGLSGFWYWSWATSSCKKVSALTPFRLDWLVVLVLLEGAV